MLSMLYIFDSNIHKVLHIFLYSEYMRTSTSHTQLRVRIYTCYAPFKKNKDEAKTYNKIIKIKRNEETKFYPIYEIHFIFTGILLIFD